MKLILDYFALWAAKIFTSTEYSTPNKLVEFLLLTFLQVACKEEFFQDGGTEVPYRQPLCSLSQGI